MNKLSLIVAVFLFGCSNVALEVKKPPAGAVVAEFPDMEVGEKWIVVGNDWFTGTITKHIIEVTAVNADGSFERTITVPKLNRRYKKLYNNRYEWIASIDLMEDREFPVPYPPRQFFNFPIWVGKKWQDDKYRGWNIKKNKFYTYQNYYKVLSYKKIKTEAGDFWAFKIWIVNHNLESQNRWNKTIWYSPEVKNVVKYRSEWGEVYDLIEYIPTK